MSDNGTRDLLARIVHDEERHVDMAEQQRDQIEQMGCGSAACPTLYFDAERQVFGTHDISVPVWQKDPFGRRMICCFGENEGDIRAEVERTGRSEAAQRVRALIAAGRCACELRNPRGTCCFDDVIQAVAQVEAVLQDSEG